MFRHKSHLLLGLFAAFALLLFVINPVQGQSILEGKLTGAVTDDTGVPLPGVTVEITSNALIGGARSAITSESGSYAFLNLPVGKYRLTATLQGFKTAIQENISINADSVRVVDITLTPGVIEEEVTVTAAPPVVDARTSTTSTTIDDTLLEKMPSSRNAFYDLALSAPGMMNHGNPGATGWMPSPSAYGGAANENVFLLNGVNTTNPQAAAFGSLLQVNYNAVEEVRMIALGSKAEYGSFSGVAIDVLTKSGSNEFHGNFALYSILGKSAQNQPDASELGSIGDGQVDLYISPNPYTGDPEEISTRNVKELEGNFTLGGPIIKDRLWFYGGFDYVDTKTDTPIWPNDETWTGRWGDLKLTAAPGANHRAWIAYHYENNQSKNGTWDRTWDPEINYGVNFVANSISSQWQWMASGKTVLTAKYLGFWSTPNPSIPDDAPQQSAYINWWKWARCGVNGHFPWIEKPLSKRHTVQADISHYAEDFLGEHDIKFGVQYTRGNSNWLGGYMRGYANFAYPQRWTQTVSYMQSWYGDTGLKFYNRQQHTLPFLTKRTANSLGFFFDDQWTPTRRLTINLGLRFDRMTAKYDGGEVYEQPSTPAGINETLTVVRDREATDNIFDFKTWAPRIGITYALTSDMKTIFRASYGRYYLPLAAEYLRKFGPDMPTLDRQWIYYTVPWSIGDANNDNYVDMFEVINSTRALNDLTPDSSYWDAVDPSWQLNVADGLKDQYTDQITVNLERELFADFSGSVTYIYKNTKDMYANWRINSQTGQEWEYERVSWTTSYGYTMNLFSILWKDYNGDGVIDFNDVSWIWFTGDVGGYEVRNIPEIDGVKAHRTYHGVQFVLRKRYSNRWQMLASFLFSASDGIARRSVRQDVNFEGPMIMDDYFVGVLDQLVNNMEGPLPFTSKYEFKLSGSYLVPGIEADLGLRFRYNSGRPYWPLEDFPLTNPYGGTGLVITNNGTFARTVAIDVNDPYYYPAEKILDLRLSKDFRLADYGTLNVAFDVLNVFNENTPSFIGEGGVQPIGRVTSITIPSRKIRLNVRFQF